MLAAGSVNLHAVAGGSGPALLLIGGWPQTWYTWRAIMPHLLSEGFSVIAVDPRGTGTSDIVASDDSGSYYDITTVSDELVAMMNALGHERYRNRDRKSTRLNSVTNAQLVCRLLLEKKKKI